MEMEGIPILISDSEEGLCSDILHFVLEKGALPFILVKDFETVLELTEVFPPVIPIVLNIHQNIESSLDHLNALPDITCIFNFDGEIVLNLFKQTFGRYRTLNIYKVDFDIEQLHNDILEASSEGYTLIINLIPLPLTGATLLTTDGPGQANAILTSNINPTQEQLIMLEKLFFRKSQRIHQVHSHSLHLSLGKAKSCKRAGNGISNPIGVLLKKWFSRFNPCAVTPILNTLPIPKAAFCPGIKSPQEINHYIRNQQSSEIQNSFSTIHQNALSNWRKSCDEKYRFTPAYQQQFQRICMEIHRKGEEGRMALLDNLKRDIERTKQWDHVLGEKAIERIKIEKENEIEEKVQQFLQRKMIEAKEKIDGEVQQSKIRGKMNFYREILDEQVMELVRIKEKYQKRHQLLMLPYTGELSILKKK